MKRYAWIGVASAALLLAACSSSRAPVQAPASIRAAPAAQPALQPDAFDAPAPTAVAEAQKAAGESVHAGHETGAVIYTCPMHPEVTSDKPGNCPKCGMTLVKKE